MKRKHLALFVPFPLVWLISLVSPPAAAMGRAPTGASPLYSSVQFLPTTDVPARVRLVWEVSQPESTAPTHTVPSIQPAKPTMPEIGSSQITTELNGCYEVAFGGNLATCLRSCDHRSTWALSLSPSYDGLSDYVQQRLYSEKPKLEYRPPGIPRIWATQPVAGIQPNSVNSLDLSKEGHRLLSTLHPRKNPCLQAFDGNLCLDQKALALMGPGEENPVDRLANALSELVQKNEASLMTVPAGAPTGLHLAASSEALALSRVTAEYLRLREALNKKRITGFLKQGFFYHQILKQAPAVLCQLESRELAARKQAAWVLPGGELQTDAGLSQVLSDWTTQLSSWTEFADRLETSATH